MRYVPPGKKTRSLCLTAATIVMVMALLAACGGGSAEEPVSLSPAAAEGRLVAQTLGCVACHGMEGQGLEGLGPPWQGLYETQVRLVNGTTVIADREYLTRSILQPDADLVEGFTLPMPPYKPTDEQLEAVLTYLEEVG